MPVKPKTEAERLNWFELIIAGMEANDGVYKDSPVKVQQFKDGLAALKAKRDQANASQAATSELFEDKGDFMSAQLNMADRIMDFAEAANNYDDIELQKVGWGAPAAATGQPPGQARTLEIVKQEDDKLSLDWKSPSEGGKAKFYNVENREMPNGNWKLLKSVIPSEVVLEDLPRKIEMEFRVISVNSSGAGVPSNIITATL